MNEVKSLKTETAHLDRCAFALYMNEIDPAKFQQDLQKARDAYKAIGVLLEQVKFEEYD